MQDTLIRPRRSLLYVPANRPRMIDKARRLDCDGLILDLEDAVPPEEKVAARLHLTEALAAGGFGKRELIVRINGLDGPFGAADLDAVAAIIPDGIALPKVSGRDDVAQAARRLDLSDPDRRVALWAMIETPEALLDLAAIARADDRLAGLVVGVNDLVRTTRVRPGPERAPLVPWLMMIVAAARAAGLAAIDGVFDDLSDTGGFVAECRAGRDMGFDGKSLLHPDQIGPANDAFRPSPDELAAARRLIDCFALPENAGRAVIRCDGRMAERLHLETAERLIALDAEIALRLDSPTGAGR